MTHIYKINLGYMEWSILCQHIIYTYVQYFLGFNHFILYCLSIMKLYRLIRSCGSWYQNSRQSHRKFSKVLGIETSCDDTGCAIVDSDRNVLGEYLQSQQQIHLEYVTNWSR